jgi:hypothetical protein
MRTWKIAVVSLVVMAALVHSPPASAQTTTCGVPVGPNLPDLIADVNDLAAHLSVDNEKFSPKSCGLVEGFVSTPGPHQLLRFTTSTPNIGAADLFIGNPALCPTLYTFSPCHGHYHFNGYAEYRLWTEDGYATWVANRDLRQPANVGVNATLLQAALNGKDLITGRKQGFCFEDSSKYSSTANDTPTYVSCQGDQGISVGWTDVYDYRLEGQYIQIDGLKAGTYIVENQVNPDQQLPESSYVNNTIALKFMFTPAKGQTPAIIQILGTP